MLMMTTRFFTVRAKTRRDRAIAKSAIRRDRHRALARTVQDRY
jgi:hypothetical protein